MMELKFLQIALKVNEFENDSFLFLVGWGENDSFLFSQQRQNVILRDDLSKNF